MDTDTDYSKFLDICNRKDIFIWDEDLEPEYKCWKDSPPELRNLWENDSTEVDPITRDYIEMWNNLREKDRRTITKHKKFQYISEYIDDLFITPIDIVNLHLSEDILEEFGYKINEIIEGIIEKHDVLINGSLANQEIVCKCFPDLHRLIFYMNPNNSVYDFPLPRYDNLPIENISRWKKLVREPSEIKLITWLENNIENNELKDVFPMNRMYG